MTVTTIALAVALSGGTAAPASAQLMTKPQVANLIKKVENGVDDFRKYLEKRGENASQAASAPAATGRRGKATPNQKANATAKKDALDDALGDLNRSTNRLRRKFDATDTWMETKAQVEKVLDDGRTINSVVARGSYGADCGQCSVRVSTTSHVPTRCRPWPSDAGPGRGRSYFFSTVTSLSSTVPAE
jgi:hypothetical protein